METLTIKEKQTTTVNFLRNDQKTLDFRYRSYKNSELTENRRGGPHAEKTIHWIGAIELVFVRENEDKYPLLFANRNCEFEKDCSVNRDVDGASKGNSTITLYRFQEEILTTMLQARRDGYNYFNVLIEETVHSSGRHTVHIFYNPESSLDVKFGFKSKKPWFEMPVSEVIYLSHKEIEESFQKMLLLGEGAYTWLK